jgi:hypothetical protein
LLGMRWCASKAPPPPQQPAPAGETPLDAETRAKIKVVNDMGNEAFTENQVILRNLALRGLRSMVLVCVGMVAFFIALRRKRNRDRAYDEEHGLLPKEDEVEPEDPTQRYLKEMGSLGFDVEGGEEEAAALSRARSKSK